MEEPPAPVPRERRKRARWMTPADDEILELVAKHRHLSPMGVAHYGGLSVGRARQGCSELADRGLLFRVVQGLYRITDQGQLYLAGRRHPDEPH